jgi:hypothetical protein
MLPTLAFVLATGFTQLNGNMIMITVPGIANENACHALALKMGAIKHACHQYEMAASQMDMADAIQDAQQDGIIR